MDELNIFVSVGGTATNEQESFVRAVEDRLRSEGLIPHTVGRNTFSADAPLKTVTELMDECSGMVVVAFERYYFPSGLEKRGGAKEVVLSEVRLPTAWNQVEAGMAYSRGLPLLVIVEAGLKSEALLQRGYDWYVQWVRLEGAALTSLEFNSVLASWKQKVMQRALARQQRQDQLLPNPPSQMTVGELISGLKPAQLWSVLAALAALIAGAFALGAKLLGGP
jgi:hypothetical protein